MLGKRAASRKWAWTLDTEATGEISMSLCCDPLTKPSSCEVCSAFTHVAAFTLAQSPIRDRYPKASDISSPPCLLRLLPAGANRRWALHPLESAALSQPNVLFYIAQYQSLTSQYPNFGQYSPGARAAAGTEDVSAAAGEAARADKRARPLDRPPLHTMVSLAQRYDVSINRTGPEL